LSPGTEHRVRTRERSKRRPTWQFTSSGIRLRLRVRVESLARASYLSSCLHRASTDLIDIPGHFHKQTGPGIIPWEARADAGQKIGILGRKPRFCSAKNWFPAAKILGPVQSKRCWSGRNFKGEDTLNWALLVQKARQLLRLVAKAAKTGLGRKNRHLGAVGTENYPFWRPGLAPRRSKISKISMKPVGQKLGDSSFLGPDLQRDNPGS
jgi:hypothetical protein